MREPTLLKLALTCSIIGVIGLFFLSETISIDETAISKLDGIGQEERVQLTGIVARVATTGNTTFLTIERKEQANIILFSNGAAIYDKLRAGENVSVIGKVAKYKGKPEIVADKVIRING